MNAFVAGILAGLAAGLIVGCIAGAMLASTRRSVIGLEERAARVDSWTVPSLPGCEQQQEAVRARLQAGLAEWLANHYGADQGEAKSP